MAPCAHLTTSAAIDNGRAFGGDSWGAKDVCVSASIAAEDCGAGPINACKKTMSPCDGSACFLQALAETEHDTEPDTQACSDEVLMLTALTEEQRVWELHNPNTGDEKVDGAKQRSRNWEYEESTESESPDSSGASMCSSASYQQMDSMVDYFSKEETIIIFDWDDTICPTTALSNPDFVLEGCSDALQDLVNEARKTLLWAYEVAGEVVIVTNATEGWVESSCEKWLPGVWPVLDMFEVTSARSTWEPMCITTPTGWKAAAFEAIVRSFYSRYWRQSWKNVIVIGDASYEHEALAAVERLAPDYGRCRAKSIRFASQPSIELLARELQMLRENFDDIVHHDDNLDLCFYSESL